MTTFISDLFPSVQLSGDEQIAIFISGLAALLNGSMNSRYYDRFQGDWRIEFQAVKRGTVRQLRIRKSYDEDYYLDRDDDWVAGGTVDDLINWVSREY